MKAKVSRSKLDKLKDMKFLVQKCDDVANGKRVDFSLEEAFAELRAKVQSLEHLSFLSPAAIDQSKVTGPRIFEAICINPAIAFPFDIVSDVRALYRRWTQFDVDPDLLRGIITKKRIANVEEVEDAEEVEEAQEGQKGEEGTKKKKKGKPGKFYMLDKDYPFKKDSNFYGEGHLTNGQWYPFQICAVRDGAHGEKEKGVSGKPGNGAYSVILSGGSYDNNDQGNDVTYYGTKGKEGLPSPSTTHLMRSLTLGTPVRLLRTAKLPASNEYRPAKGVRYDGLYDVVSQTHEFKTPEEEKQALYSFHLVRRPGQDPIRNEGESRRPTERELIEYAKLEDYVV